MNIGSLPLSGLTNGFSKKLRNHEAAISLFIAHYNLCRVHETIRMTPAMMLGVMDHIWTIGELIERANQPEAMPEPPASGRFFAVITLPSQVVLRYWAQWPRVVLGKHGGHNDPN